MKVNYPILQIILVFCCLCHHLQPVFAGNDKRTLGGKQAAMGNTSVTFTDVYAVFSNQAGLAGLNNFSAGIYAENRFLLKDLSMFAVALALPLKRNAGTFGSGITYFGNSLYNERHINLAYGRKLFKDLSIGIELDYVGISIADYGSAHAFTFGIGAQYVFLPKLVGGAHIYNPLRWRFTDFEEDRLPTIVKGGLAYLPSEILTIAVEAEKNLDAPMMFKSGIDYRIIEKLSLRAGISTAPFTGTFGIGLNLGNLKIDFANSFHPVLGYSPHFGLIYSAAKRKSQR